MGKVVKKWNLGKILYEKSNMIQRKLAKLHTINDVPLIWKENSTNFDNNTHNTLLVMEHEPIYTTGLRDYISQEEQNKLIALGAQFYRSDRGGLITFHGPGQLTAYPVLNLRHFKPSVKWYVCRLEQIVIETCNKMGIKSERSPKTGVWVGDNKICAIGVHISRGVTTHGIALNCCTDLKWFEHIVPCGIEGKGITSLSKEIGKNISIDEILPLFYKSFEDVFDSKLVLFPDKEKQLISDS